MTVNFVAAQPKEMIETVNSRIIRELKKARFSIWLANVWFTDKTIYNLLIEKVNEGINVEILLHKDAPLNCHELSQVQDFIDAGGEFFLINEAGQHNGLNKSFCMIDFSTVIDDDLDFQPVIGTAYSAYFMKEYPEALVEHYINEYFLLKNNYCISRFR